MPTERKEKEAKAKLPSVNKIGKNVDKDVLIKNLKVHLIVFPFVFFFWFCNLVSCVSCVWVVCELCEMCVRCV